MDMTAAELLKKIGGTKAVQEITGLSKASISQWRTGNSIPRHWLLLFREKFPELDLPREWNGAPVQQDKQSHEQVTNAG